MNEKFESLPEERKLSIINAALEVFAKNDYKHAVTDDIAAKADISKGLLFYYFKNKSNLYGYIFKYVGEIIKEQVIDEKYKEITDFFELLEYSGERKCELLTRLPYIYDFAMKAYFSSNDDVNKEISKIYQDSFVLTANEMFKNIDFSKFKDGVDYVKILNILIWSMEGYYIEKQRMNKSLEIQEMMQEYRSWISMFKKMAYKEAYL